MHLYPYLYLCRAAYGCRHVELSDNGDRRICIGICTCICTCIRICMLSCWTTQATGTRWSCFDLCWNNVFVFVCCICLYLYVYCAGTCSRHVELSDNVDQMVLVRSLSDSRSPPSHGRCSLLCPPPGGYMAIFLTLIHLFAQYFLCCSNSYSPLVNGHYPYRP